MPNGHAAIAPSSLYRTIQCAYSVPAGAPYADLPPTPESLEGDVGHWVARQIQRNQPVNVGQLSPIKDGPPVDDEMIASGMLWAKTVGTAGATEMPVHVPSIHHSCFGFPDYNFYSFTEQSVTTWDYKYGHRFVSEFEFWQGIGYAAGTLDLFGLWNKPDIAVNIGVVQPRYYGKPAARLWKTTVGALRGYVNIAEAAVLEALGPNPRAKVGPACLDCAARHVCETLQQAATNAVYFASQGTVVNLPASAIGAELTMLHAAADLIDARITGLTQYALAMKAHVPGWKYTQGMGRLAWNRDAAECLAAADAQQIDIRKVPGKTTLEVCTPTQAKQRGLSETLVNQYASQPRGQWKLTMDDGSEARKAFGANK